MSYKSDGIVGRPKDFQPRPWDRWKWPTPELPIPREPCFPIPIPYRLPKSTEKKIDELLDKYDKMVINYNRILETLEEIKKLLKAYVERE